VPRKQNIKTAASAKPLALYEHQEEVKAAHQTGLYNRYFLAWHRRAGKDVFGLEFARERMEERKGTYWHLFPFHVQAKRAIWNGIDARDGMRFIDRAFPPDMRESENNTEMTIGWKGSLWQMLGSDNYDRAIGSNPCGVVFSEWALCDPAAWDYIRPIIIENKGWAAFITTFRGRNHAFRMFQSIKDADNWFASLKTIRDTHKKNGEPIVSQEAVDKEIRDGMSENLVQQEFYCNPDVANSGAIFNKQYNRILAEPTRAYEANSKLLRVSWGIKDDAIAAIAYQDKHIVGVHTFSEWNLVDAIQAIGRRHPNAPLVHYSDIPDPSLFVDSDGYGFYNVQLTKDEPVQHALCAYVLNSATFTATAKEQLADFAMTYAPYRRNNDAEMDVFPAVAKALGVMRMTQPIFNPKTVVAPLRYASDRGVI
jgi:hypothetical protein